jgi:ABC-2 type transport system permease protein
MTAVAAYAMPAAVTGRLWPFFAQEYIRIMRSRLAWLIWVVVVYTVAVLPFLMERPPPELLTFIAAWLGPERAEAKLLLFMWIDAAMNKFAIIMGPALAGGMIVAERSRGTLDLMAAKPIQGGDYFTVKLAAACAALATFYVAACAGAATTFPLRVEGFDVPAFIALSGVHLLAAVFGATFSATVATFFHRRLTGLLVSVTVLGVLVGMAFLGFYYPAYRTLSYLNPFFDGIVPIGNIGRLALGDVLLPVSILIAYSIAFWRIGRARAAHLLRG